MFEDRSRRTTTKEAFTSRDSGIFCGAHILAATQTENRQTKPGDKQRRRLKIEDASDSKIQKGDTLHTLHTSVRALSAIQQRMNLRFLINATLAMQSLRSKLLCNNAKSYGPLILSGSPTIAELLAGIGYSHIVVDMEHSPSDLETTTSILRAIDAAARGNFGVDNFPVVRAPSHDDVAMTKRILDVLRTPAGIMFPMIENAQQAKGAVESTRYPPHYPNGNGIRGCAYPFVRASQYGKNTDYFETDSNQHLLTIVQVESEIAIENIPEIGMVDGVDVIFLGPFDISCSINDVGNFEKDGKTMTLLRHAERLVRETSVKKKEMSGTPLCLGGFRSPGRDLKEMFSEDVGYQFVCGAVDLGLLGNAAAADFAAGKSAMQ